MIRSMACTGAAAGALAAMAAGPALAQGFGGGTTAEPSALRATPAETTAAAVTDPDWMPPRTSWGHPDLEGVWTSDDMRSVPAQRPEEMGERESLTPEEFLERARRDEAGRNRAVNDETFLRNEWGVRTFGYSSRLIEPADGRMPAMTEAGLARADERRDRGTFGPGPFDTVEGDFTLYDRCVTRGVIGSILPVIYGNGLRIVQSPNEVAISYEMIHDTRIIPLDGRPAPGEAVRQHMGVPRGHWDGDTLVIETANFTDETSIGGNGNGVRHSAGMTITERLTRVDPEMIEYIARVEDPATYTAPFTYRLMITTQPNYDMYEYNCHEGNGAVGHALSGERAYDRAVADAVAAGRPVPPRDGPGSVFAAPVEGAEVTAIGE
jgi:hypothetical protein